MGSLMDYSNAGSMFSTQITNNVNSTFLNHQRPQGLNQMSGTTSIQSATTMGTNSLLKNVIGTPSMSSSTSSGYGSQAVSLGNLTNDDTLSLRSMSVDETPDLDRSSSASPPVKSNARAETVTTPFTPSGTQKRFNPFMKDNVMETSASSTSTLVKTPMTPTKIHPLANSDEEEVEAEEEEVVQHNEAYEEVPEAMGSSEPVQHEQMTEEVENNNCVEVMSKNDVPVPEWVVLGESVLIRPTNSSGVVAFIGVTHFQVGGLLCKRGVHILKKKLFQGGVWIGIELDTPTGKNDGTVQGNTYFTCKPKHGLFVRADKLIHDKRGKAMRAYKAEKLAKGKCYFTNARPES